MKIEIEIDEKGHFTTKVDNKLVNSTSSFPVTIARIIDYWNSNGKLTGFFWLHDDISGYFGQKGPK